MKSLILSFLAILIFFGLAISEDSPKWNETKSTHFIVYYQNAKQQFIDELIAKAEEYYERIADDLGFRRFDFWLWENRAKVYIYNDAKDYQKFTKQPAWSLGAAIPQDKIIYAYPAVENFFERTLPHELGHIIFREFVGFHNPAVPLWLDEGVAVYQERGHKGEIWNRLIKEAVKKGTFLESEQLSKFNSHKAQDKEQISLFYAESAGIIDYLIKEFGKDKFVLFCQNLRDKKDLARALASAYPFSNMKELVDSALRK
ncbi:MAG: peptidase MA family metallohydrolase [Candidatus Omnitrophota bacterium]|nr:peptidase MA family metallohydrolase [Candidatus Omnitrophota bacterium]